MLLVILSSLAVWYVTRDRLPENIRIATAAEGGLYHHFGKTAKPYIEDVTGATVQLVPTQGTSENRRLLLDGQVDLAIIQTGATSMDGLAAVAPLYHDVVFVICRQKSSIRSIRDLSGSRVCVGMPKSGMRSTSMALLDHYDIALDNIDPVESYFLTMIEDDSIDASIVTTGLINPDLELLLGTGEFRIVPIDEVQALSIRKPYFKQIEIPRGMYHHDPAVPERDVETATTTALLVARQDASDLLIRKTVQALYQRDVQAHVPTMIESEVASHWTQPPLHPEARAYFDPYGGIDVLASFMESVAAGKGLIFAFGAGLYLLIDRWRRAKEQKLEAEIKIMKERLDSLLDETVRIERAQIETSSPDKLKQYLDEVTRIKLKALDELTHEDLRGDRMFLIFLMQCGNLISKIQAKIGHGHHDSGR